MYVAACAMAVLGVARRLRPLTRFVKLLPITNPWMNISEFVVILGVRRYISEFVVIPMLYTNDGVRSAFHQFPGLIWVYGVLVGSSPTIPSSKSYSLCYKLILTASPSFGLCKGGDVL